MVTIDNHSLPLDSMLHMKKKRILLTYYFCMPMGYIGYNWHTEKWILVVA
jgi:hypothetical protein